LNDVKDVRELSFSADDRVGGIGAGHYNIH
jgi:hypothetical protein